MMSPDLVSLQILEEAFRYIAETRMRNIPVLNSALQIEAVGFRPFKGSRIGILITPWFMNLICFPDAEREMGVSVIGTTRPMELPAVEVGFLIAENPAIGSYLTYSLFSPMFDFADMGQAREVADAILEELFTPKAIMEEVVDTAAAGIVARLEQPVNRRGFLGALFKPVLHQDKGRL
ncbi:MAG: [NiFe]-hydrogenase assembly chaperone HybE [Burkholderiales bacterium]